MSNAEWVHINKRIVTAQASTADGDAADSRLIKA
jgi:hypothetical protein